MGAINSDLIVMKSSALSTLKNQLRQQTRQQRQALSATDLLLAEQQVAQQFNQHLSASDYKKVAIYLQHDNELGTQCLITFLLNEGCQLYLPKLQSNGQNQMQFCRYNLQSKMSNNRYGIPEPETDAFIAVDDLDLILLPLTAFDHQGNRLGMGGGFYDRALSKVSLEKTLLVGLAYDFQQTAECPTGEFDQALQMILTPSRGIVFHHN